MSNKITVIYHSADFDGLFCREIAKRFLPGAELIGWDYGDPKIPFPSEGAVYILDLSPDSLGGDTYDSSRIIWIDHHKTAIEKYPATIPGYRIDGVSACRLAWQWFSLPHFERDEVLPMPLKQDFIDRTVSEPYAVRLAGEYDIWDKRDPNADVLQMGLRSRELSEHDWKMLLSDQVDPAIKDTGMDSTDSELICSNLLQAGFMIQAYQNGIDEGSMKHSFIVEFDGLKFLALNTPQKGSFVFASKDVPETGHDALLKLNWTGTVWDCSMYHAKGRSELDLSIIAQKYGGGGHKGACGFRARKLPFLP
jgi:oligoribonuclease NrnB/cAMP/cGMP phosphodiesterase (DHH superfamily)